MIDWEKPWDAKSDDRAQWVFDDFEVDEEVRGNSEILFAYYKIDGYEGSAFVLFRDRRTGELSTVEAGHCSCNGLEGQWSPVKTTADAERARVSNGGRIAYDDALTEHYRAFVAGL